MIAFDQKPVALILPAVNQEKSASMTVTDQPMRTSAGTRSGGGSGLTGANTVLTMRIEVPLGMDKSGIESGGWIVRSERCLCLSWSLVLLCLLDGHGWETHRHAHATKEGGNHVHTQRDKGKMIRINMVHRNGVEHAWGDWEGGALECNENGASWVGPVGWMGWIGDS